MEPQGNISQTSTPSWGAPAYRSPSAQTQSICPQQNPFSNGPFHQHGHTPSSHRHQRPSPYYSDRGRNSSVSSTFQNNSKQNGSPTFHTQGQGFSPRNPFSNKGPNFSSDNPFQSKEQNFSPSNPSQNKGQSGSPGHRAMLQYTLYYSPSPRTPGVGKSSFSPRTPGSNFYTPSPRNGGLRRNNSDSFKCYGQRNNNMSNPGGSSNIKDYINSSMLEDPWKDLPPIPMRQSY